MRADLWWEANDLKNYNELTKGIEEAKEKDPKFLVRRGIWRMCDGYAKHAGAVLKRAKDSKAARENAIAKFQRTLQSAQAALKNRHYDAAEQLLDEAFAVMAQLCPPDAAVNENLQMERVKLFTNTDQNERALQLLNNLTTQFPNVAEFHLERGEINLEMDDFDAALFDFHTVQRLNPQNRRAQDGIAKAQQLKKEVTHIDYYIVLGIEKTATPNKSPPRTRRPSRCDTRTASPTPRRKKVEDEAHQHCVRDSPRPAQEAAL
jgi:DnaJ family protein C protein 7